MSGPDINPIGRKRITLGGYSMPLPASRIARVILGVLLIIGGMFAILPLLGLWMIPLGLLILSVDFAFVRRGRRRLELWWAKRRAQRPKKPNQG